MSFKAGDRVVVVEGKLKKYNAVYPVLRQDNSGSHLAIRLFGEFLVPCFCVRHATPEEIAVGHRIDANTDYVTDIKNHISPMTIVQGDL